MAISPSALMSVVIYTVGVPVEVPPDSAEVSSDTPSLSPSDCDGSEAGRLFWEELLPDEAESPSDVHPANIPMHDSITK